MIRELASTAQYQSSSAMRELRSEFVDLKLRRDYTVIEIKLTVIIVRGNTITEEHESGIARNRESARDRRILHRIDLSQSNSWSGCTQLGGRGDELRLQLLAVETVWVVYKFGL